MRAGLGSWYAVPSLSSCWMILETELGANTGSYFPVSETVPGKAHDDGCPIGSGLFVLIFEKLGPMMAVTPILNA